MIIIMSNVTVIFTMLITIVERGVDNYAVGAAVVKQHHNEAGRSVGQVSQDVDGGDCVVAGRCSGGF